jgi:hypothetical protein
VAEGADAAKSTTEEAVTVVQTTTDSAAKTVEEAVKDAGKETVPEPVGAEQIPT